MSYPSRLYKYVIPDRVDILKNPLIRFTQPSALNDPFELQPIFSKFFSENELNEIFKPNFDFFEEALNRQLSKLPEKTRRKIVEQLVLQVKKNPKILQEQIDKITPTIKTALYDFTPEAKKKFSDVLQTFGILSFSEKFDHTLLWAHYADSHRGFAIEFKTDHEFFNRRRFENDELFHLRKVKYVNHQLAKTDIALSDMHGDDILATKEIAWEYEAEWRMIIPLASANKTLEGSDKIYLYTFPLSSVTSVIVGARASPLLYEGLRTILLSADYEHISLKMAKLNTANQTIHIDV